MYKWLIFPLFAIGCGGAPKTPVQDVKASSAEEVDLNGDGKPDAWKHFIRKEGKLIMVKKEIDLNIDGKIDVWRHYDETGAPVRDEMDMDFDGQIDSTALYADGKIIRKEIDLAFDKTPD